MLYSASLLAVAVLLPYSLAQSNCGQATQGDLDALPDWTKEIIAAGFNGQQPTKVLLFDTGRDGVNFRTTSMCMGTGPYTASPQGEPTCSSQTTQSQGTFDGASGTVTASISRGQSLASTWSTTNSVTSGVSLSATVSVGVPEIADFSTTFETSLSISSSDTSSTTNTLDQTSTVSVTVDASDAVCEIAVEQQTCYQDADVAIPMIMQGGLVLEFVPNVAPTGSSEEANDVWIINLDNYGMNANDRTLPPYYTMSIRGNLIAKSFGTYRASCSPQRGTSSGSRTRFRRDYA